MISEGSNAINMQSADNTGDQDNATAPRPSLRQTLARRGLPDQGQVTAEGPAIVMRAAAAQGIAATPETGHLRVLAPVAAPAIRNAAASARRLQCRLRRQRTRLDR